jgi:hypothetical protein
MRRPLNNEPGVPNKDFPHQYLGDEDLPGEEWRPVIYQNTVSDKYFVSNYGGVKGPRGRRLKWAVRSKKLNLYYASVSIVNPRRNVRSQVDVHVLVANAFLPITEETLPEPLRGFGLDENALIFIRTLMQVDHIDDNPKNPRWDNLSYVSPRQNNYINKKEALAE